MPECGDCGRSFDTDRGLSVHRAQMHPDDDDTDAADTSTTGAAAAAERAAGDEGVGSGMELTLSVRHALIATFLLGLFAGGFAMATVQSVTGVTGAVVQNTGDTAPTGDNQPTQGQDGGGVSVSSIDVKNDPVLGADDAPVTVVAWEDYQCPFCKRFETQVFPQLKENYIDTGKVRFVFKDFAFLGPDSTAGAVASQCVWRQVQGSAPEVWNTWKDAMFANQDGENSGWGSTADIINMTRGVAGVDADQLASCMEDSRSAIQSEMSEDKTQGRNVGITGTPGFLVYRTGADTGKTIVGAQPYSRFKSVIESKLP